MSHKSKKKRVPWGDHVLKGQKRRTVAKPQKTHPKKSPRPPRAPIAPQ